MSLSPEQCRAARALLNWSQTDLAEASGIARRTIARLEGSKRDTYAANRALLREVFETAGVAFIDAGKTGVGAYLREP